MTDTLIEYQLVIRNAGDTADDLVISSVRGGTNPYAIEAPSGDGAEFDPVTGAYRSGSMTFRVADAITSGTDRVVTAQLEDATFRQQLTSRPAYIKERVNGGAWNVMQAGIITGIRLGSDAAWDIDVGDTTRATRNLVAFAPKRDAIDATQVEPLADYLARWPTRGCLLGGPIIGGFLGRSDLHGWEFRVRDSHLIPSTYELPAGATFKYLEFVAGYDAPGFGRSSEPDIVSDLVNKAIGPIAAQRWTPTTFSADLGSAYTWWPDLVVQVGSNYFAAASCLDFTSFADKAFFVHNHLATGIFVWDANNLLSVSSAIVRVRVFDAIPSGRSPLYYSGHPLDLWTKLCDDAGLAYDAGAVATTKALLGGSLRINLRITGPQAWASFVEGTLYGPCGFSVRTAPDGTLVPFTTRTGITALPSVEITNADVAQDGNALFDLSEPDAITKVTFNQTQFIATDERSDQSAPPIDGIVEQSVTVERTSGDGGGPVQREQAYTIPGFLDTGSGSYEPGLIDTRAGSIFDRFGRGRLTGEMALLRDGAGGAVTLGQEVLVSLRAMPNHNKRLGDDASVGGRCVQIVRITPTPAGPRVRFVDSGPNAEPTTPVPTITLADGPVGAGVALTITNAATLNAASPPIAVRIQSTSVVSGTPAAGDYTDVFYFAPGTVPTTAVLLPLAPLGNTVYAQARSEQFGKRVSAYSTPVSHATAALDAPTSVSVTVDPADGSRATVAWDIGTNATAAVTDIYLRVSTLTFPDAIRMASGLLAGTISYPLQGLIPGTAYIVTVVHRDAVTGSTAKTEYTFTAGSTTRTLSPPTNPVGIVGSTDPTTGVGRLDGTYGLNVTAVELPGFVTVWEAIETGVGTGTYGSFTQVSGRIPSVSGGPTSWRGVSSNQLLRKQLKARHEADGCTASTYTAAVTLDAWGVVVSPPSASAGPSLDVTATPGNPNYTITYTGSGGTVELSIDGGAYSTAAASPITVARPSAGSVPKHYAFRISDGTQTIGNDVTIPSIDADTDTNTVTPDLVVTPSAPTTTTQDFTATASNPSGGAGPALYVTIRGTTGSGSGGVGVISDGVLAAIPLGTVVTVNRPAFGTTTQSSVEFTATISGGGSETIQRTILNQVKTTFGPSLTAAVTYSGSTASIAYVGSGGTVEVSINGAAYATATASPIVVTRPAVGSLPVAYDFRILADGQTVSAHATVVPLGFGPSIDGKSVVTSSNVTLTWTSVGTLSLKVDGVTTSVPSSPHVVTRDGSSHTYDFLASLDSQTFPWSVFVPALPTAGSAAAIENLNPHNLDYPGDGGGSFDLSWSTANMPSGVVYTLSYNITTGNTSGPATGTVTPIASGDTVTHPLGPSYPGGRMTLVAKLDGVVVATGVFNDGLFNP